MAGFHAALAFIVFSSGKSPKTHSGTRCEFARLSRDEQRLSREQVAFLAWSYELENIADYDQEHVVSIVDAERAISEVSRLIETVAAIIGNAVPLNCQPATLV